MAEPDDCTNLEQRIQHIVTEEIAPMLQMDGGGIEVISIQDGVVQVRLLGTCAGCPSTVRAIIMGIEEELRRHVPEVNYLEAIP
jgi:Fe-S cluster biogenesis protein NfuA